MDEAFREVAVTAMKAGEHGKQDIQASQGC